MKKLIIENNITIKDALQKLESNSHKYILFVNKYKKFIKKLKEGKIIKKILNI